MVVREPEPELLLDLVELPAREAGIDRAHRSESKPTHGLPAELPAVVSDLIDRCHHEAGLYLAGRTSIGFTQDDPADVRSDDETA